VLICDDDAGFVEALRATLAAEPEIEVAGVARDGLEALELAESLAPLDVILLDIEMPRMDGIQTLAALRKRRQPAALVMLTGIEDHEVIGQARRSGPDGFLLKSIEPDRSTTGSSSSGTSVVAPELRERARSRTQRLGRNGQPQHSTTPASSTVYTSIRSNSRNVDERGLHCACVDARPDPKSLLRSPRSQRDIRPALIGPDPCFRQRPQQAGASVEVVPPSPQAGSLFRLRHLAGVARDRSCRAESASRRSRLCTSLR
jgi:DNA-binding NarL/FixJ family response regulator